MALILLSSFISFVIILRILIQYYYTGDYGIRFATLDAPYVEIISGSIFVFSFVISGTLIIVNHFGAFGVQSSHSNVLNVAIACIGFTGIAITVIAQVQMGRSWRIGVDQSETTDLRVEGLYSKSRNPIYLGVLLYWLAIAISLPHPAIWACAGVCWLSIELIVRQVEEPYLSRVHGQAFDNYCRESNRYLIW